MRVNVYAEEMTERIEIISKEIDGQKFTGLRIYLELPASVNQDGVWVQHKGPFIHKPGDDDSSAVTFWGKQDLRVVLLKAIEQLDAHYMCATAPYEGKPHEAAPAALGWNVIEFAPPGPVTLTVKQRADVMRLLRDGLR